MSFGQRDCRYKQNRKTVDVVWPSSQNVSLLRCVKSNGMRQQSKGRTQWEGWHREISDYRYKKCLHVRGR